MEVIEFSMLDAAIKALGMILEPERILFLSFGVLLGLILGVIPGLGGLIGLSLLLPFTFDMNPITALAFMMGLQSVTATSDSIPAVLFYPGELDGAAGLRFMGVLDAEHNYRPKIF